MEWIDKQAEELANQFIDQFLGEAKNAGSTADSLYNDLGSMTCNDTATSYKNIIIDRVLLPEQHYRCCYCMKCLADHTYSTVEHIIPQNVSNNDQMNVYFGGRAMNLNPDNVCLTQQYVENGFPEHNRNHRTPYPHLVAYHNFAAVCPKCNNERSNKVIEPLFLYEGISEEVTYNEYSGEMTWENDPFYNSPEYNDPLSLQVPTVDRIGLNEDLLKITRQICFYFRRNNQNLDIFDKAERERILYEVLGDICMNVEDLMNFDFKIFYSMLADYRWKELIRYDYFYTSQQNN